MRRTQAGTCLMALLAVGCGKNGSASTGPALEARPEVQTCLPEASEGMPERLSDTGCFSELLTLDPGPDLIPYEVNSALWTDGAFKRRYLVVPSAEEIIIEDDGSWVFPNGSVLIKVFGFEFRSGDPESRRPVETRFMVRQEGRWQYATYEWTDDGTDADLLSERKRVEYTIEHGNSTEVIEYLFPEYDDCITCHGAAIDDVLGPKTSQINREHDYEGVVANQLAAMAQIDLFARAPEEMLDPEAEPRMASPQTGDGTLEQRARAYLDANCAHCHRPDGYASSGDHGLDLRYQVSLTESGLCESMRYFPQWAGLPRIAPGDPDGSGLVQRFAETDVLRMPSTATSVVDPFGTALLREWIAKLPSCP